VTQIKLKHSTSVLIRLIPDTNSRGPKELFAAFTACFPQQQNSRALRQWGLLKEAGGTTNRPPFCKYLFCLPRVQTQEVTALFTATGTLSKQKTRTGSCFVPSHIKCLCNFDSLSKGREWQTVTCERRELPNPPTHTAAVRPRFSQVTTAAEPMLFQPLLTISTAAGYFNRCWLFQPLLTISTVADYFNRCRLFQPPPLYSALQLPPWVRV
jgi:hypothetical protein